MKTLIILLQSASRSDGNLIPFILLVIIAMVILVALKTNKKELDTSVASNQTNKVINVSLTGGLIGLFSSSPQSSLNERIKAENANGWKVIQITPADSGNIFLSIFRFLMLVATIFLYTTANGYYVVMERKI